MQTSLFASRGARQGKTTNRGFSAAIVRGCMKLLVPACIVFLVWPARYSFAIALADQPLFLKNPVTPVVMLNMSSDHQLFFKAYDDYSDLDGDGLGETSYDNDIDYYGYFDFDKCYDYISDVFTPVSWTNNHYCSSGQWSGNFLNWTTMTRMDVVRKMLYGGKRSTDSTSETILERAFLPTDAHSFAKYYAGSDINQLTPYNYNEITICNTTAGSGRSENVTAPPIMRIVSGNYSLWASNERWQCNYGRGSNGNNAAASGINAFSSAPSSGIDLQVRIRACVSGLIATENDNEKCKGYVGGSIKPSGLLQEYGENDQILFGMLTGSYNKNKSGGVLRKNIGSIGDEIDPVNGSFVSPGGGPTEGGIIQTLNALRIYGYDYSNGIYNNTDGCPWGRNFFNDGSCSNWGNPQAEIYLESLRYLAGETATSAYYSNDSNKIADLKTVDWAPAGQRLGAGQACTPLNIIQFNASTTSYDGDQLATSGLNGLNVSSSTDIVGANEATGGEYFVGKNGSNNNGLCTPKAVGSLSNVSGTCPDAPRLDGTYQIAGLARHAHVNGISNDREPVTTFGVALSPAVPKVEIPVPGRSDTITLLPACRNGNINGNCAIVDFKIVEQNFGAINTGKLYVNWEDSEQGGDFDQDMWGVLNYSVSSTQVTITTDVIAQSTGFRMGFGYVISGTTNDGFHVHSGINNFTYGSATDCPSGRCVVNAAATVKNFSIGNGSANSLEQPLYYAAKWGGFDLAIDSNSGAPTVTVPEDPEPGELPETYFFATQPQQLEESMGDALETISGTGGTVASVTANSTRLSTGGKFYQASFAVDGWIGDVTAIELNSDGTIGGALWSAADNVPTPSIRKLYSHNGNAAIRLVWNDLSGQQQQALGLGNATVGRAVLDWAKGTRGITGLRDREDDQLIGDIVSSAPAFSGTRDFGFGRLPVALQSASYSTFADAKSQETVYFLANDGFLHAVDANTGAEKFAYLPKDVGIFEKIRDRSAVNFGSGSNQHKYLLNGQIFVGDAYWQGRWRTLLVATKGAGGRGFFVLDVSDPNNFNENDVLMDVDESDQPNLGNIIGSPIVAPVGNDWKIVMANGYNGAGDTARLVMVSDNATFDYINTGAMGNNGLSQPALLVNSNGTVSEAYAGDLNGNVWKFSELDSNSPKIDLLFATNQTITSSPVLGLNPQKRNSSGEPAVMVYFGTGSYLAESDLSDSSIQSFYAIADNRTGPYPISKSDLYQKKIVSQSDTARDLLQGHATPDSPLIDWASDDGWFMDFDAEAGERVTSKAQLIFDRLLFSTVIPTQDPCGFGGSGWIMEITGVGELYPEYDLLVLDDAKFETLFNISNLIVGEDSRESGVVIVQKSTGELGTIEAVPAAGAVGRQSWRQLQ